MASCARRMTSRRPVMSSKAVQTDDPEPTPSPSVTFANRASRIPIHVQRPERGREVVYMTTEGAFTHSSPLPQLQRSREATQYMIRMSTDERFFKAPIALPQKAHTLWDTCFRSLGIVYGDLGIRRCMSTLRFRVLRLQRTRATLEF